MLHEKVLDERLHKLRNINNIKYKFFLFGDPEKVFSIGHLVKLCFALKQNGVSEYLVNLIMSLHEGCTTAASVERELSDYFSVKVGNHQRSVLSLLLLFTIVMGLLSDVRDGSLMELLYAEDLALLGES